MKSNKPKADIVLIGAGIMSATLGVLLKELMPQANILVFERLPKVADESSNSWNNAGTGHSAFCELNYTTEQADGSISCAKAIKVAEQFELSKQFWTYLIEHGILPGAGEFLHQTPHCSFVMGEKDVNFLRKRYLALRKLPLFDAMEFSDYHAQVASWLPLIMQGRSKEQPVAATRMHIGLDLDFGRLTELLFAHLQKQSNTKIFLNHEVKDIDANPNGSWELEIENLETDDKFFLDADFVFVGAGGGALKLLNKAKITEADGYGGFPVGGKWLRCNNPEVIAQHHAKVYGQAQIGAPPMSVPHLDARMIRGKRELLFGPYAGFNTKFLKHGSYWDLPFSLDWDNFLPMIEAGLDNLPLTRYLIDQVRMGFDEKFEALLEYYPAAQKADWELVEAGQRVQVIKKDEEGEGVLEFGTELLHTGDGSLAGLLGASPGASTAPSMMLKLLSECFKNKGFEPKLLEIFPGLGQSLNDHPELLKAQRARCHRVLGITS